MSRSPWSLSYDRLRKDYFEVPLVPGLGASTFQLIGIVLPKLQTPLADGLVRHLDPAFKEEFLHITVAQGEAIREPDAMADDLAWKAVIFVAFRGSGWRHVWLPIGVYAWFVRVHHRSEYLMGQAIGSTT